MIDKSSKSSRLQSFRGMLSQQTTLSGGAAGGFANGSPTKDYDLYSPKGTVRMTIAQDGRVAAVKRINDEDVGSKQNDTIDNSDTQKKNESQETGQFQLKIGDNRFIRSLSYSRSSHRLTAVVSQFYVKNGIIASKDVDTVTIFEAQSHSSGV